MPNDRTFCLRPAPASRPPTWRLEVTHRQRLTEISHARHGDVYDGIAHLVQRPLTNTERAQTAGVYEALLTQPVASHISTVRVPLSHFMWVSSDLPRLRVGIEAEYRRSVYRPAGTTQPLKYNQEVACLREGAAPHGWLGNLKLDGVNKAQNVALLELALAPFPLASPQFERQRALVQWVQHWVDDAEVDGPVRERLERALPSAYGVDASEGVPLRFGPRIRDSLPVCQVTLELPLTRLGDPADQAIPALVTSPAERALLHHVRGWAERLVAVMRPYAADMMGNLFEPSSIKLGKIRGYLAQSLMQGVQKHQYGEKRYVSFHLRSAGPDPLSARDKAVLRGFLGAPGFDKQPLEAYETYTSLVNEAFNTGKALLPFKRSEEVDWFSVDMVTYPIVRYPDSDDADHLRMQSGYPYSHHDGTALVELRQVYAAVNRGLLSFEPEAVATIKNAQEKTGNRPRKVPLPNDPG